MSAKPGSRKKAVEAREALAMLDKVEMAFLTVDERSMVTYANRMAAEFFGGQEGSLVGVSLHDLLEACLPHTGVFDKFYSRISTTGKAGELAVPVHHFRWALFHLYPVEGGMNVVIEDVTHRRLRDEPQRAALLTFNSLPEAVFLVYENGYIYYANDAACRSTGYTLEELKTFRASGIIPDLDPWVLKHNGWPVPASARFESVLWPKAGDPVSVEVCATTQTMFRKTNFIVSVRDITERKRAEEALRESARELEEAHRQNIDILESISDCFYALDKDLRFIYVNKAAEEIWGLSRADLIGRKIEDVFAGRIDISLSKFRQVLEEQTPQHYEVYSKVIQRWGDMNVYPTRDGISVYFRDTTDRKRAEEALNASNEKITEFLGSIRDDFYVLDLDWKFVYANRQFTSRIGKEPEDLVGNVIWEMFPKHLGTTLEENYRAAMEKREIRRFELPGQYTNSWYQMTVFPSAEGITCLGTDITERKRTEEALVAAKAQAELYVDLMGHDINNMHQIALGYLELARDMMPHDDDKREFLDKPIEVMQRSAQLIKNVRKLQKHREGMFQTQDVDACEVLRDVQREFGSVPHKEITLSLNGIDHCYVRANELLNDVFANLVSNAIKHTGDRADINVGLDSVSENGGQFWRVYVEDDGPGIPDDFKARIFNRMLKSTNHAKGMGLGLFLVKSLVDSYGGRVWVEDRVPGDHTKGARFVVMLPAVEN